MKLFLLFLFFTLNPALAQDSYHSWEETRCDSGESCLIITKDSMVIKGIAVEDREGLVVGKRLSSRSNIADTIYPGATFCFAGSAVEVCSLLDMMSFDEGHVEIRNFACRASEKKIELTYTAKYDMSPVVDVVEAAIVKCQ